MDNAAGDGVKVRFGTLVLDFHGVEDRDEVQALFEAHGAATDDVPHAIVDMRIDPNVGVGVTWYPGQPMGACTLVDGRLTVERREWAVDVSLDENGPAILRLHDWRIGYFDQAVSVLVQMLAPLRAGAVCLHGSSVKRGDDGFAFIANAETGKTTIARLSREAGHIALAEEMSYVGWPNGDERPWVYSLPLRERNNIRTPERHAAPLAGLYRLRQAQLDQVDSLKPRTRILELAARAAIGARSPVMMDAALAVVERLDGAIETKRLRFTLSTRFWQAIDEDLAARRVGSSSSLA